MHTYSISGFHVLSEIELPANEWEAETTPIYHSKPIKVVRGPIHVDPASFAPSYGPGYSAHRGEGLVLLNFGKIGFRYLVELGSNVITLEVLPGFTIDEVHFDCAFAFTQIVIAILGWEAGYVPYHCVGIDYGDGTVIAIGRPGSGKSSLLSKSLGSGARLVTDDVLLLRVTEEGQLLGIPSQSVHLKLGKTIAEQFLRESVGTAKWVAIPVDFDQRLSAEIPLTRVLFLSNHPLDESKRRSAIHEGFMANWFDVSGKKELKDGVLKALLCLPHATVPATGVG